MKTLDFKPVKRCGRCNHLISQRLTECPYCKGKSFLTHKNQIVAEEPVNLTMPKMELTARQKKIGVGLLALAAVIFGIVSLTQYILDSRALNKSILEPLSESVLEKQAQKDEHFSSFYDQVSTIREALKTPEDQKKYESVTYKQLKEFLIYYSDNFYCEKVEKDARKQFDETVLAPLQPQINGLKEKWEKYIEDHDVSKFLTVEVIPSGFSDDWYYYYPAFYFKITEPKGTLKDCSVDLECYDHYDNIDSYNSITGIDLEIMKRCNSKENRRYGNMCSSNFWDNYEYRPVVRSVTLKNGTTISEKDIENVPETVKNYIEDPNEQTQERLIVDQIDPQFKGADHYIYQIIQADLKEKDPICYELVDRVNNGSSWTSIPRGFKTISDF